MAEQRQVEEIRKDLESLILDLEATDAKILALIKELEGHLPVDIEPFESGRECPSLAWAIQGELGEMQAELRDLLRLARRAAQLDPPQVRREWQDQRDEHRAWLERLNRRLDRYPSRKYPDVN